MSLPLVSVVMANRNGERHLPDALRSILGQTLQPIEVLLVDDASTDRSVAIAERFARDDPRLAILRLAANAGPAAARNRALALARGRWVAVVDSDDILHPDRLRRLVEAAEADGANIVADDLLVFDDDRSATPRRLLRGALARAPSWIDAAQYVRANRLFGRAPALGYLKPVIRREALSASRIRYDEGLRIAEDYDLVLRLLLRGARFRLVPELLYFYRRHAASVSHRLSPAALQAMTAADARLRGWAGERAVAPLRAALDARLRSIAVAGAAEEAIAALKARRWRDALAAVAAQPGALPILARLASPARLVARARTRAPAAAPAPARPVACVISRQRLVEGSTGSGAYLLGLCRALRDAGWTLHLVCPSPATLGRVPVLRVAGEGELFDSVAMRGTFRIGGVFVARDPRVALRAALGVADRLARRFGVTWLSRLARPAPYAVAVPWTAEDFLFVARHARGTSSRHARGTHTRHARGASSRHAPGTDAQHARGVTAHHAPATQARGEGPAQAAPRLVLADYAFLTPAIPYALSPGADSAVVMHDLMSSRAGAFAALGTRDSVAAPSAAEEAALLAGARLVVAIQPEEAEAARRLLPPGHAVTVAPMAVDPVAAPQPGQGGAQILFVGSGTAPNVDGLRWFLAEILPRIRAHHPQARLLVAGGVCAALAAGDWADGAQPLGRVACLDELYRAADVVVSPLRVGSGLKIKLIEALGHGKAIVATDVTAQGVRPLLDGAVALADAPEEFAAEVLRLLQDPALRAARAAAALDVARAHFAPAAAHRAFLESLRDAPAAATPLPRAA